MKTLANIATFSSPFFVSSDALLFSSPKFHLRFKETRVGVNQERQAKWLHPKEAFFAPFDSGCTFIGSVKLSHRAISRTALHGKLWKRLQIEEDSPEDGTSWYLINCVAGVELDLLAQCRIVCDHFPKKDVDKFVVPTERHLRSHGNSKKVVDVKVRYPGYVFCKIRLTEDVYETLQELELARSWMGTVNRKGYKKLPPAPIPLNEEEVKKFKGLEDAQDEFEELYGGDYSGRGDTGNDLLAQYAGYDVGQMVKILKGNFQGEDGTVRRLKDGQICVRMFTYGQVFDEWFNPDAIRPLTDLEVMRGLSGPTAPINQDQFDVSIGKKDPRELEELSGGGMGQTSSLRSGLLQSAGYGPGRNRKEDRIARGEAGNRDMWGRSPDEIKREEENWLAYREEQRANQRGDSKIDTSVGKTEPKKKEKESRKGDTWGIVERSSWTGGEYGFEANSEEEEKARQRRTADLYKERAPRGRRRDFNTGESRRPTFNKPQSRRDFRDSGSGSNSTERRPVRQSRDGEFGMMGKRYDKSPRRQDNWSSTASKIDFEDEKAKKEDDFFESLMSELSDDLNDDRSNSAEGPSDRDKAGSDPQIKIESNRRTNTEDDFFENLMSELGGALGKPEPYSNDGDVQEQSPADSTDDFFANLELELANSLNDDFSAQGSEVMGDDAFFGTLESEINSKKKSARIPTGNNISNEDFFENVEQEMSKTFNELPENDDVTLKEDFFAGLIDEVADELDSSTGIEINDTRARGKKSNRFQGPGPRDDLSSMTVLELKEMLRSKGLKVGGRKSELIERLQSST